MNPWTTLADERRAFADLLEGLSPEQWATPSLCGEWDVRGVATHMMVGPTGSMVSFMTAMLIARGSFDRANRVMVERKLDRPTSAVVDDFRAHADSRFTPPTMDWHAPVTDFLVHRLDVTVPLGIEHGRPLEPWPVALDFLVSKPAQRGFIGAELPRLRFVATDVEWSHGDGDEVRGPVEALALAITRRTPRLGELVGPGSDVLRTWSAG